MPAMWNPEVVVDEELARALIGDLVPGLRGAPLRLLGEGWDSTVWRAGDEWLFRFPRREIVVPGFLREVEVLPRLAPELPLPVPVAEVRGAPDERFRWPWAGFRILPGRELVEVAADADARVRHGRGLGRFLRALHDIDPATVTAGGELLPIDAVRRADMPFRVERTEEQLGRLAGLGLWRPPPGFAAVMEEARGLPEPDELVICHGDLHLRHLLVSDAGDLAGVIDWIDVCRADACLDLLLYWGYLDVAGREAFLAEYGPIDAVRLLRARVITVSIWGALAEYAHAVGMERLGRVAVAGLDLATVDW
ncbi:MAG TPA: phosphotransferase [Gaiellales bacterium]|nr:phosphotransferase [Gaiellales bacterium]